MDKEINKIKILQNQDKFTVQEYREAATPLIEELKKRNMPNFILKLRGNNFITGILMYLFASEYNVVITIGPRTTLIYGTLNRLYSRNKIHIAKELYIDEKDNFKGNIVNILYKFALKNIDGIVVNASGEIKAYSRIFNLPENIFHFIPWPTNIDNPEFVKREGDYLFAAGLSLRDWETFFRAVEDVDINCIVVASKKDVCNYKIPSNVELYTDIPYKDYLNLLKKSIVVVIPLIETARSTGQVCLLEAMAFGKPTITAKVTGAIDYVEEYTNGLCYKPHDINDLKNKIIEIITNKELRIAIATNGYRAILSKYNKNIYVKQILTVIRNIIDAKR
jgi:glycosyltransferase involved in cell wall biosynthesis